MLFSHTFIQSWKLLRGAHNLWATAVGIINISAKLLFNRISDSQVIVMQIYAAQSSTSSLVNRALQTCGRIGRWVARLAAITLLLAAALPTILSTNIGLQAGTSLASHFVDGDIHIDKVNEWCTSKFTHSCILLNVISCLKTPKDGQQIVLKQPFKTLADFKRAIMSILF